MTSFEAIARQFAGQTTSGELPQETGTGSVSRHERLAKRPDTTTVTGPDAVAGGELRAPLGVRRETARGGSSPLVVSSKHMPGAFTRRLQALDHAPRFRPVVPDPNEPLFRPDEAALANARALFD